MIRNPKREPIMPQEITIRKAKPTDHTAVIAALQNWWGGRDLTAMLPTLCSNSWSRADLEETLKNFVSYQIAYAREQKAQSGQPGFDKAARDVYFKAYPHARVEYSPDNKKFTVVVPPEYVPVFPHNYMTAMPSYRADETGQIRMIRVWIFDCEADSSMM